MAPAEETAVHEQRMAKPHGNLLDIFWTFLKVGTTSFGGASRAIMYSEAVERHHWMDEKDFLAGFAVSQVLPGANPVNLALFIGLRAGGGLGATVAVLGMVIPAFCVIMLMGFLYRELGNLPGSHFVLEGVASAGVGATLAVGVKVTSRLPRDAMTVAIAVAVFISVGVLHWPLVPVVAIGVPFSIAAAYVVEGRRNRAR